MVRELDRMVAREVMGLELGEREWPCGYAPDGTFSIWEPLDRADWTGYTDADFAWLVGRNAERRDHWLVDREPVYFHRHENGWVERRVVARYSTEIKAAWEVARKFHHFWVGTIHEGRTGSFARIFQAKEYMSFHDEYFSEGESIEQAICLAALKAVEAR
jgi:hypothetical protein